eukprot:Gb_16839 [translate_table: standard]
MAFYQVNLDKDVPIHGENILGGGQLSGDPGLLSLCYLELFCCSAVSCTMGVYCTTELVMIVSHKVSSVTCLHFLSPSQRQNDLKGKYDHDDDEDGDVLQFSMYALNEFKDGQVGVQDLRMKLLRKNSSRTFQSGSGSQNGVRDLREKLSGKRQSPPTTKNVLRHMSSSRTMDASRRISSSRTMDASERTLPTRITNASRRMSPPETIDASWQTSSPRNIDLSRNTSSPSTVDASRHASFLVKVNPAAKSIGASKPIVRSVSGPSSSTHKHAYPVPSLLSVLIARQTNLRTPLLPVYKVTHAHKPLLLLMILAADLLNLTAFYLGLSMIQNSDLP